MLHRLLPIFLACLGYIPPPALPQMMTVPQQAAAWQGLHSLIDRVVTAQLFLYDIPGATVALVGDGQVLHLNGYGYADRELRTPVSAERTLFGTGSVSKVFTWTAVMQLVEQGRLDLDRDVNDYLSGLQIPATYPRPVTLAHLMTHTAGFEERAFGFYAHSPGDLVPLQRFLADHLPARVYPPGEVSAYSNYGAALAGHIVARTAGMPFERYIEARILEPLGMSRSSFRQPLSPDLAPDLAIGYRGKSDITGYGWYQARPSAALRTTAADMAQFMRAHLQQGRLGDTRILQPASSAAMQRRQFTNHPAVSGITYGFLELKRGGQQLLWHPGDTLFYTAALFLLPEPGLGLFVAYNRAGVGHARLELLDAIQTHLLPGGYWPEPPPAGIDSRYSSGLAGHYRSTRTGVTSLEKLFELFSLVRVHEAKPGSLQISGLALVEDVLWVEQTPGIFRDSGSEEIVVFEKDSNTGNIWLFEGNTPVFGYTRLPWYTTPAVHSVLLGGTALVFLTAIAVWSLRALRHRQHGPAMAPWSARLARPVAVALCVTNLVFMAGMYLVLGHAQQLLFGITPFARAVLLLPVVSAVLTLAATALALMAWRNSHGILSGRMYFTLIVAAGLVFLWILNYWRLL